jgi:hypothetical protein
MICDNIHLIRTKPTNHVSTDGRVIPLGTKNPPTEVIKLHHSNYYNSNIFEEETMLCVRNQRTLTVVMQCVIT